MGSYQAITELADLIKEPPIPVAVWVGPSPAVAFGGAFNLLRAAPIRAAAPGARLGHSQPWVAGGIPAADSSVLAGSEFVVEQSTSELDLVQPTIGQLLVALDGRSVAIRDGTRVLDTALPDGSVAEVSFHKPGLLARTLRLANRPESAFFFLTAGITVAAFEFYAVGPGIAAVVAMLSLILAGYGVTVLPVRGWALILVIVGLTLLTISYQKGTLAVVSGVGTGALVVGGLFFTERAPQLTISPFGVMASIAAVLFFYLLAMPTVGRARFSTPTIGRDNLIGRAGTALTDFDPNGVAEIAGARWHASAHREEGLRRGDGLRVVSVEGSRLEVENDREKSS